MKRWIGFLAVAVIAFTGTGIASTTTGKSRESYNFFAGIPAELSNPNGSLPGENEFSCRPTKAHSNPVVLIHGTGGGAQTNWGSYVPMLKNAGFCVYALTYGAIPGVQWPLNQLGGTQPMQTNAAQVRKFVDKVLLRSGARRVDIVAHSQGTLVADYYAKFLGGKEKIDRYVSLAPLWLGTTGNVGRTILRFAGKLGVPETSAPIFNSLGQMLTGSAFLADLWRGGGPYLPGIKYTNISTRYDDLVFPYTSGQVPGGPGRSVTNIVMQDSCAQDYSDHLAIAGSRRAAYVVHNALDPAHRWPVPCEFVPPLTG